MDKAKLISMLIGIIMDTLTAGRLKDFADMILDFAEDAATNSTNKYDDVTVLPMCALIRSTFDIPDGDD